MSTMPDHETLSALFDGELDGDARRFAVRRLQHDADWQGAAGRWQMIGDAMRRQAPIAAPAGFAARVAGAIHAPQPVPAGRPRWLHWGGGALAASLALATAIAWLPGNAPTDNPQVMAAAPAPAVGAPAAQAPTVVSTVAEPARTTQATPATPREDRPVRAIAAVQPREREAAARRAAVAREVAAQARAAENPFNLRADETPAAQPWPRASAIGAGAFTARYGQASDSPAERTSFYPFEPPAEAQPSAPTPPQP